MKGSAQVKGSARTRRRRALVQAASLALFLGLVWSAALPHAGAVSSIFLRLDPLAALTAVLAGREWIAALWPAFLLLGLTLLAGRWFCGWACPLGATLDAASGLMNRLAGPPPRRRGRPAAWPKYFLLAAILAAALGGLNLAFWGAPLPLATRFYALLLHPLLLTGGNEILSLGRPFLEGLDLPALSYLSIATRHYDSMFFLAGFFGLLFCLERVRPRFWCGSLCPAGALLGLFSQRPLWRRRTANHPPCGRCEANCPAFAIQGSECRHGECLTCRACTGSCAGNCSSFGLKPRSAPEGGSLDAPLSRRAFLAATAAGLGLAGLERSALAGLLGLRAADAFACLRPPGALPEPDFLARCHRCGLCMRACPTNGLTPAWLAAGPAGIHSPILVPRRGPCEPDCNLCGRVCPTLAITPLDLEEKRWAKIGGAVVHHHLCLAWAEDRRCMVCQEVCPYGAIALVQNPGAIAPVPLVVEARCFGCGYCELHCPTAIPAITIQPSGALRLARGSYILAGRAAGLLLDPGAGHYAPGGSEEPDFGLPPGFTE